MKEFFVAIDSDGTVFDVMELKHKECFIPNVIRYWNLQPISKYARETAEFVNLYSVLRGVNRFPAYLKMLDLLKDRVEVKRRNYVVPSMDALRKWVEDTHTLSNDALENEIRCNKSTDLIQALEWSNACNRDIAEMVKGVPPFPYVAESLDKLSEYADIAVVSSAQEESLHREWSEHGLDNYLKHVYGQERGSKKDCISRIKSAGYSDHKILMIGDAMGDFEAAQKNGVLFYPIIPGKEEHSWYRFYNEAIQRFFDEDYAGEYQKQLINQFIDCLSEIPSWNSVS